MLESSRTYDVEHIHNSDLHGNYVLLVFNVRPEKCFVEDTRGCQLLQVNSRITKAFHELTKLQKVDFGGYVSYDYLMTELEKSKAKRQQERTMRLHANVYGPKYKSDPVGALLSAHEIFLQEPIWRPSDVPYHNPHFIRFEGITDVDL